MCCHTGANILSNFAVILQLLCYYFAWIYLKYLKISQAVGQKNNLICKIFQHSLSIVCDTKTTKCIFLGKEKPRVFQNNGMAGDWFSRPLAPLNYSGPMPLSKYHWAIFNSYPRSHGGAGRRENWSTVLLSSSYSPDWGRVPDQSLKYSFFMLCGFQLSILSNLVLSSSVMKCLWEWNSSHSRGCNSLHLA